MKKIVLIQPAGDTIKSGADNPIKAPPLGLYVLAAVLRRENYEVRVVDPNIHGTKIQEKRILKALLDDTDVIGISSHSFSWAMARNVAETIYDLDNNIPIILGGIHPTNFDVHALEVSKASYVVRGEGELTLVALLKAIQGEIPLDSISGITYRESDGTIRKNPDAPLLNISCLQNMPLPAYDLVPDGMYSSLTFESSRGCRGHCVFCSVSYRGSWRACEPDWVTERLRLTTSFLDAKTTSRDIYFVDDCFATDLRRTKDICRLIIQKGIKCKIILQARVIDMLLPQMIESISGLDLSWIDIGVECGYDEGLKKVGKKHTIAQVEECAKLFKEHGLIEAICFNFVIGLPWEDEKACLQTIHFAAHLVSKYGGEAAMNWWTPYPSYLWAHRSKWGISVDESIFDDAGWVKNLFFRTHPNISPKSFSKIRSVAMIYISREYPLYIVGVTP
ncbi:B12-binding domain-containing radical SAM protein [Dehalococcoidia bacterium]|nr:B12-binding domain-containing radical SAM protein [Dehalococcoidia bacterium]